MKRIDLTGNKYGKLTVVEMLYNYKGTGRTRCRCICDCGKEDIIRIAYALPKATDSSCGCGKREYIQRHHGVKIDGQKFGRLFVLETLWDESPIKVKCKCDCGNIGIYIKHDVYSGHTQSCGCLQSERAVEANVVNHTGEISDYGVEILSQSHQNKKGQWVWNCKCGTCGNIFKEVPARVLNNHIKSCGCIKYSSREKYINDYLTQIKADFQREYSFDDLRTNSNYPLRFDFAIFKNNDLVCLIEYDGQQHFYPVSIFGGEESYQARKEYDKMKDDYCNMHNINLIRIPYTFTEKKIKETLNNIINP